MKLKTFLVFFSFFILSGLLFGYHIDFFYKPFSERISALNILDTQMLKSGKQQMEQQKIVICGIARDNIKELPTVIKYIERTGKLFKDYRVIIFENDSNDGTKQILKRWQKINSKINILSKDYANQKRPTLAFLAFARNQYLVELENNPQYQDFDMIMVVDMDMSHGWDKRGLLHSFSQLETWDAICSNGIFTHSGQMWDMFAFRNDEFQEENSSPHYWTEIVPRGQRIYPVGAPLIPVQSCFGGLAFYKRTSINGCRYTSENNNCEHIPFHRCLSEKHQGKMYMNPSQIIRYKNYH